VEVSSSIIIGSVFGVSVSVLGFMAKYWFEKINKGQEKLLSDMDILKEHKYTTTAQIDGMKESWQEVQKKLWEEIKDLSESMQESYDKIVMRVEQNTIDIQNIKSENRFMAKMLKDIDEKSKVEK